MPGHYNQTQPRHIYTHSRLNIPYEDRRYIREITLQQQSEAARELVTQKYILGMRILMLGFERAYRSRKRQLNGKRANVAKFANEFRIMAARGAGSTVLALTEDLPKIIDTASVVAENVE